MDNGSQHRSEPSVVALLGGIANDVKNLLIQELVLTKLEMQDKLRKAKTAAIALGTGIGVVAIGGMLLMLMLVQVLAVSTEIPLWGCYGIVGGVLVVLVQLGPNLSVVSWPLDPVQFASCCPARSPTGVAPTLHRCSCPPTNGRG